MALDMYRKRSRGDRAPHLLGFERHHLCALDPMIQQVFETTKVLIDAYDDCMFDESNLGQFRICAVRSLAEFEQGPDWLRVHVSTRYSTEGWKEYEAVPIPERELAIEDLKKRGLVSDEYAVIERSEMVKFLQVLIKEIDAAIAAGEMLYFAGD